MCLQPHGSLVPGRLQLDEVLLARFCVWLFYVVYSCYLLSVVLVCISSSLCISIDTTNIIKKIYEQTNYYYDYWHYLHCCDSYDYVHSYVVLLLQLVVSLL